MDKGSVYIVADQVAKQIVRDRQAPHYTEEGFDRKLRRAKQRESQLPVLWSHAHTHYLLTQEWNAIIAEADLTEAQFEVIDLRIEGYTFEEIGRRRGHTKQGAARIFEQGARKLAAAYAECATRGLHEVYVQLTQHPSRR